MFQEKGKFGIPIRDLQQSNPQLFNRIVTHLGSEFVGWTAGQIASSVDGDYSEADPRVIAGWKASGDFTALRGSGPKKNRG